MKLQHITQITVLCVYILGSEASISLGATAVGVVGAALYASFDKLRCTFYECCKPQTDWIKPNISALRHVLDKNLHGQHLVKEVVPKALKSHFMNNEPTKALVMSFHGWTGGGKNYVSKFIAESIYKLGMKSKYVHMFVSTVHFPHEDKSDIYKLHLQDWIRGNVSKCERSLFIFDEIDKMPLGMINGIKPFIDYHESIDRIDFRKSIFLFLSNTGGPNITQEMLNLWHLHKKREEVSMNDLENLIQLGAFNEQGGLHKSELIKHSLVDHYVPFLPLERTHIKLCVRDELYRRGIAPTDDIISKVAEDMSYYPANIKLFSKTGCKRVAQKVGYMLANEEYDSIFGLD
ncbi:hypothetical protein Pcinc_033045 [Petrolisthes cinctipes]|uniref:Torsin n=1 Tax=Petrolisthes cinctipes TaxID=88211 RepID=A0AAE1K2F7_PETCI|nr:hypothetical protein Pcinc_033045 [Petrolisthes cinctipes]